MKRHIYILLAFSVLLSSCKQSGNIHHSANALSLAPAKEYSHIKPDSEKPQAEEPPHILTFAAPDKSLECRAGGKEKQIAVIAQKHVISPKIFKRSEASTGRVKVNDIPEEENPSNPAAVTTGILSFIFSLISIAGFFLAFYAAALSGSAALAFFSFVLSLTAIILGIISLTLGKKGQSNLRGFAIAGITIGGLMLFLSTVLCLVLLLFML